MKVTDFLPEFVDALRLQLQDDEERWGDTWLHRPREGQEARVQARFNDYFDHWFYGNEEFIPWLKIAGNAMIAWIRENHPELFQEDED